MSLKHLDGYLEETLQLNRRLARRITHVAERLLGIAMTTPPRPFWKIVGRLPPQAKARTHRRSLTVMDTRFQAFLIELCDILGVPHPDPAGPRRGKRPRFRTDVAFHHGDGTTSTGQIDLYKRACFILEAKQGSDQKSAADLPLSAETRKADRRRRGTAIRGTKGWDDAMVRARGQAEAYAKALPVQEGWPPFLIVVDVGHVFELFADFSRTGKHYTQFPDASSFRIPLDATPP